MDIRIGVLVQKLNVRNVGIVRGDLDSWNAVEGAGLTRLLSQGDGEVVDGDEIARVTFARG
jgi:hypothetical protein